MERGEAGGLRILVTSGGTSERIDRVRKITNMSTGRLGSLIADAFAEAGARVVFVCGEGSLRPSLSMEAVCEVGGVGELAAELERLLAAQPFDCVVHAMAVSDYRVRAVTTAEALSESAANAITQASKNSADINTQSLIRKAIREAESLTGKKLSSNLEDMILLLERTPKVIERIKKLQPQAVLVGFKLLAGVSEAELESAARKQMERTGGDLVLANDLERISGDRHEALLFSAAGTTRRMSSKQEIARAIVESVVEMRGDRG